VRQKHIKHKRIHLHITKVLPSILFTPWDMFSADDVPGNGSASDIR